MAAAGLYGRAPGASSPGKFCERSNRECSYVMCGRMFRGVGKPARADLAALGQSDWPDSSHRETRWSHSAAFGRVPALCRSTSRSALSRIERLRAAGQSLAPGTGPTNRRRSAMPTCHRIPSPGMLALYACSNKDPDKVLSLRSLLPKINRPHTIIIHMRRFLNRIAFSPLCSLLPRSAPKGGP